MLKEGFKGLPWTDHHVPLQAELSYLHRARDCSPEDMACQRSASQSVRAQFFVPDLEAVEGTPIELGGCQVRQGGSYPGREVRNSVPLMSRQMVLRREKMNFTKNEFKN